MILGVAFILSTDFSTNIAIGFTKVTSLYLYVRV